MKSAKVNNQTINQTNPAEFTHPEQIKFAEAASVARFVTGAITEAEHQDYLNALHFSLVKGLDRMLLMIPNEYADLHTRILANLPATPETPFKFSVLNEVFDVRPLFDVLQHSGAEDLAAIIDTFLSDLILHLPEGDFTETTRNNLWHMRELRNAILTGAGGPELTAWKRRNFSQNATDYIYLEIRATPPQETTLQKSA